MAGGRRSGVALLLDGPPGAPAPHCPHGPALLFAKIRQGKEEGRRFYACSACRERKDCGFFQWEDEKVSEARLLAQEKYNRSQQPFFSHAQNVERIMDSLLEILRTLNILKGCMSLRRDLPATVDTVKELETPWPSLGSIFNQFSPLSGEEIDRTLQSVRPTTCPLDPCPSSLDPTDLVNYRPVANLPFLGKVIEQAAAGQIQGFLNDVLALDPFQSGFRPGHGTETLLVALTDDLRRHLDRGGSALLILLDLSAAFDTVDYDLLTHRLADVGIRGTALQWLVSFLHSRGQRVALGEKLSPRHPLVCGVPQGAICSRLLFNIYMCPLAQLVRSFGLGCHQYADDTQLYLMMDGQPGSAPDVLEHAFAAVTGWLKQSQLKLNPTKTEVLYLSHGGLDSGLQLPTLDGAQLVPVPRVKSLGLILDASLKTEAQVTAVLRSSFFHLRQTRQLVPYLSTCDLTTVIQATVISRLDYCNLLYVGLPLCLTRRLQLVQNAVARIIMKAPNRAHITPVLRELH